MVRVILISFINRKGEVRKDFLNPYVFRICASFHNKDKLFGNIVYQGLYCSSSTPTDFSQLKETHLIYSFRLPKDHLMLKWVRYPFHGQSWMC